jgi:flagellar biosynthetic protein FliR
MTLDFNSAWVTALLLCSIRLSALLLLTPVLQAMSIPAQVRVILVMLLAVGLIGGMRLAPAGMPNDLPQFFAAAANELAVGALMAFGIFCAFAAFSLAGNALDFQIGFSIANIFDPITRSQTPLIASLFGMAAVALFFALDAHHLLLRGVAYSLERVPLGTPMQPLDPAALAREFGGVFTMGLMLAAPPLFCLFLVEICLAVLSRNLPQLNIFMFSIPINIAVGLAVLALMSPHIGAVAKKIFASIFQFWEAVL